MNAMTPGFQQFGVGDGDPGDSMFARLS